MADPSRQDIERIFQEKFAALNHLEITTKETFAPLVDACLQFFIQSKKLPQPYSQIVERIDTISKGAIRSAISRGIASAIGAALTIDTYKATHAAMEDVLKWLDKTNEQDPEKIGYIIDQYIRYWSFYFSEDYHLEDPSALKQFQPDLQFRKYKK